MTPLPVTLAKLAGLKKLLDQRLENPRAACFDPLEAAEWHTRYLTLHSDLVNALPHLFADLPVREPPRVYQNENYEGRGHVGREFYSQLRRDLDYILEVRAHSELAAPAQAPKEFRVFISHGRAEDWRKVQDFVERDLAIATLELAQQPNLGRTVLQKLDGESDRCSYAVVVMTGDDDVPGGPPRARENVVHEIGYFQGKFGLKNVCLLHEEGTNIPSNIHGLVYVPFPPGHVEAAFGALRKELVATLQTSPGA